MYATAKYTKLDPESALEILGPKQKRKGKKYHICPSCEQISLSVGRNGYTCFKGCGSSEVQSAFNLLAAGNNPENFWQPKKEEKREERPKGEPRPFKGYLQDSHPEVLKLAERYGISEILARLNFGYSSDSKAFEEFLGYSIDRGIVSRCAAGLNNQNQVRVLRGGKGQWMSCRAEVTGDREFFKPRLPGNIEEYRQLYQRARENKSLEIFFTEGLGKTLKFVEVTKLPIYGAEGVNNLLSKPEFKELTSDRSKVTILFDADSTSNWNVAKAELSAGKAAIANGTQEIFFWKWNPELGKGFDDFAKKCEETGQDWRQLINSYDFEAYLLEVAKIFPEKVKEWRKQNNVKANNFWSHTQNWASTKALEFKNKFQQKLDAALTPKSKPETASTTSTETVEYIPGKLYGHLNAGKIIEYKGRDRLEIWGEAALCGVKNVIDRSGVGSGKSYAAGNLKPFNLDAERLIYLSSQHRNAPTKSLGYWQDLPSRHNGLVADEKIKNPDGTSKTRLPKGNEKPNVCGNCKYAAKFNEAIAANLDHEETKAICRVCEFGKKLDSDGKVTSNLCATEEGDGYGFKFQRWQALKSPYLRAHPASLPSTEPDEDGNSFYDNAALFVDEAEAEVLSASAKEIIITESKLKNTFADLEISSPELFDLIAPVRRALYQLIKKSDKQEIGRYGKNDNVLRGFFNYQIASQSQNPTIFLKDTDEAKQIESSVSKALAQNLEKEIAAKGIDNLEFKPQWLTDFLRVLKSESYGSMSFNGSLVLRVRNPRINEIFQASKFNIFADATANVDRLIDLLGLDKSEVLTIQESTLIHENLTITQIDFERDIQAGDRSIELQQRIDCTMAEVKTRHKNVKAFNRKENAKEGDLTIFADNRGVNHASKTEALVAVGDVYAHKGAIASDYQLIYGRSPEIDGSDEDYNAYYLQRCQAEIVQMVGRLRSGRRTDECHYYHFGNSKIDMGFLLSAFPGCQFERVKAGTFCPDAATKDIRYKTQIITEAINLVQKGAKLTQKALGQVLGIDQSNVSRFFKSNLAIAFKSFKNLCVSLIENLNRETHKKSEWLKSLSPEELSFVKEFIEPNLDAAFAGVEDGEEIDGEIVEIILAHTWEEFGNKAHRLFRALNIDMAAKLLFWILAQLGIDLNTLSPTDGLSLWEYEDMIFADAIAT